MPKLAQTHDYDLNEDLKQENYHSLRNEDQISEISREEV